MVTKRRGRNRFVILLPELRIVVKFPRITRTLFKSELGDPREGFIKKYSRKVFFIGLISNWQEFLFYRKTHHCFLQPTYFSFLGLINIQRFGEVCKDKSFWPEILDILFNKEEQEQFYNKKIGLCLRGDIHHWQFSVNFSFWDKRLYIHDYGNPKTQKVILEFGEKIFRNFSRKKIEMERIRNIMEFEGSVDFSLLSQFSVSANILNKKGEIIGGQKVANFNDKKFAEKCRDMVNDLDLRYDAKIV